ncbi:kinesin light chain 1 protein [Rutstroemia sp. NJR-2017a BBW]|nr:kinesin light chain 1 protein [Rutstroemia sp. NJR-2017a BBW]
MSGRKGIEKDPDAIALVEELDGLPLALSTAGVYLEHVTTSFSDYLQLYKTSWLKLQSTSPLLDSYENRTLYTTWQITFDRIEQRNPASAKLLKLWAYFRREDLWFDLLRHTNSVDDEWIQKLTKDELDSNEAITLLCTFGLVDPDRSPQQPVGARGYSVHSCVHSWILFVLNKEWDKSLARLALTCVASEVPDTNEKHWWLSQRRLLQHATQQAFFIADAKVDIDGPDWVFHNLGDLYSHQGKIAEAEAMYLRALQGREKALGPDHTSILHTINNLSNLYSNQGSLYSDQGKLAKGEKMYLRALEGYENALGLESASSYLPALNTMFAFGDLFSQTDRKDMARAIYYRALSGYTTVQGPSSKRARQVQDRLQALQVASTESNKLTKLSADFGRAGGRY